jgi:MFS family permease
VPVLSALTDRLDPRRIYLLSLLGGAVTAFGFAAFADGAASAALWRFLQGAAFGGAHMPGMRALCDAVPAERQTRSVAVFELHGRGQPLLCPFGSPGRGVRVALRVAVLAAGPRAAVVIAWDRAAASVARRRAGFELAAAAWLNLP